MIDFDSKFFFEINRLTSKDKLLIHYLLSIYYINKCGLYYLAMFKLFQRIIFACLTKEFLHVQVVSYIAMVKIFLDFPV